MCQYIDMITTYRVCMSHRVTDRTYFLCRSPNPAGAHRYCADSTPSKSSMFVSTKRQADCPVCAGCRLEIVVKVREPWQVTPRWWRLIHLIGYRPICRRGGLKFARGILDARIVLKARDQVVILRICFCRLSNKTVPSRPIDE